MIFFLVSSFETLFSAFINLKNVIIVILGKLRCAFYEEYYIYDMSRAWIDVALKNKSSKSDKNRNNANNNAKKMMLRAKLLKFK